MPLRHRSDVQLHDGTIRQLRQLDQQPVPETYPMFSMVYVKRVTGASPATSSRNLFSRRNSVAPRWSADPPATFCGDGHQT